ETADGAPVYRLQKLSSPDTRRSAFVHPGLPQNLCPSGGARALIRDGPGQSQSVDSCPLARAPGGVADSVRCSPPLPHSSGPTPRWRGGRRGHGHWLAGGGPGGPCPSRRTGLPPFAHDGTERRIVRPQDPPAQTACYSGKKKDHTVKNVLLVNALLLILFLSDTYGGRTHDKPISDTTPYSFPAGDPP